jgi:hypothetical protein
MVFSRRWREYVVSQRMASVVARRGRVGRTTDTAGLDLDLGPGVLHGALERGDGVAAGLLLHLLEGGVDDALGQRALAPGQDLVHELGHQDGAVDGVRRELAAGGGSVTGHA